MEIPSQTEANSVSVSKEKVTLIKNEKKARIVTIVLFIAGNIIGTGIFLVPNKVVLAIPSIIYSLAVWTACGLVTLTASICYAELSLLFPVCGGEYSYLQNLYPACFSFSFLLASFLLINPASAAIMFLFASSNIYSMIYSDVSQVPYWPPRLLACSLALCTCCLNCASTRATLMLNNILTTCKFLCIGILISLGIYTLCIPNFTHLNGATAHIKATPFEVASAFYYGMFCYNGWNRLGHIVEDMRDPSKNLLKALLIAIIIVSLCYITANFSYLVILGVDGVRNSVSVAIDASAIYLHKWNRVIAILISVSAIASGNSTYYCSGRMYFDGARNGCFPAIFSTVHKYTNTMMVSFITTAALTCVFILGSKDMDSLIDYFCNAMWLFQGMAIFGIILRRIRKKEEKQKFKVPLVLHILIVLFAVALLVMNFVYNSIPTLVSFIISFGSLMLYYVLVYKGGIIRYYFGTQIDNATEVICRIFKFVPA